MAHPLYSPQPGNLYQAGTIVSDDFDTRLARLETMVAQEIAASGAQRAAVSAMAGLAPEGWAPPYGCACHYNTLRAVGCVCHAEEPDYAERDE